MGRHGQRWRTGSRGRFGSNTPHFDGAWPCGKYHHDGPFCRRTPLPVSAHTAAGVGAHRCRCRRTRLPVSAHPAPVSAHTAAGVGAHRCRCRRTPLPVRLGQPHAVEQSARATRGRAVSASHTRSSSQRRPQSHVVEGRAVTRGPRSSSCYGNRSYHPTGKEHGKGVKEAIFGRLKLVKMIAGSRVHVHTHYGIE
jgi:hypothetical protein